MASSFDVYPGMQTTTSSTNGGNGGNGKGHGMPVTPEPATTGAFIVGAALALVVWRMCRSRKASLS